MQQQGTPLISLTESCVARCNVADRPTSAIFAPSLSVSRILLVLLHTHPQQQLAAEAQISSFRQQQANSKDILHIGRLPSSSS